MASITSSTYLDNGTARSAGEAMAISNSAVLTIRTDTRVHANAPASFTGSLGNPTFTGLGGELFIDATSVRWLAYNTGTGNVPAIGTSITKDSTSGYLLGVWASLSAAPTAVGAAMPTSGFIKLRSVTSGPYSTGALTGIGASATAADVAGWLECVWDAGTNFVVGRIGKIKSRGSWFYLDNTTGSVGQVVQIPSSSSAATNNYCPGVWVETTSGSNEYEFWSGLASAANGWIRTSLGYAEGYTDSRGKFVKAFGNGTVQFGESATLSATYASIAAQASTYVETTISGTYTWVSDVITVNTGATAHLLETGLVTGLDFTSGTATDNTFTVTVLDAYNFTVPYVGSVTGGNVTVRPGITITFTAHGLNQDEYTYCDVTSGGGVDGTYKVYSIDSANVYRVSYPHTAAVTSGNVSCIHTIQVTFTAHGHVLGNEVYLDFTSGTATDGRYIIKATAANTFNVNLAHTATTSGNVTVKFTIGHVPSSGCKVRIPNIMFAECATGSRATNSVPNATIASRPEFTTTAAGAIDLEYIYAWSLRTIFAQAYSVRIQNSALIETLDISECATALDIDTLGIGQYSAQDARALQLTSNFAGGTLNNVTAYRATIGTTDHATEIIYCNGLTLDNLSTGIILYTRSTGISCNIASSQNITFNGLQVFNGNVPISTSVNIKINDLDYNDRFIGHTVATTPYYALTIAAGCDRITLDGVSFGMLNTVEDCHPYTGIFNSTGATNIKIRNIGSAGTYLNTGVWAPNYAACGYIHVGGGNNNTVKIQKAFVNKMRTGLISTVNSDKNIVYEQVLSSSPFLYSAKAVYTTTVASLNTQIKGMTTGTFLATGQTSLYGTHWINLFQGNAYGAILLMMNEPTAETVAYFIVDSGTIKFDSSGGIAMYTVGDKATWEIPYYFKGITSFSSTTPVMSGGTIGNYRFKYQIDKNDGAGYSTLSAQKTAAELATALAAESIDPVDGIKLKLQIETTTGNATNITFLRIYTNTTTSEQNAIDYPLDTVDITITSNVTLSGAEVRIYDLDNTPAGSLGSEIYGNESVSGSSVTFSTLPNNSLWIQIMKSGYIEFGQQVTVGTSDSEYYALLMADLNE